MSKSKTDILFLSHRYNVVSGGEKALLDMIKYLVSIGIKPHVIIGDSGDITKHLKQLDVPYSVIYLPFWMHDGNDPTPFNFTSLNPTVNTVRQIVNLINELKPKICVTNTMVIPWLGYASSITGIPHAWFIHELGTGFNFRYAIGEDQTLRTIDSLSDKVFYNSKYTSTYYLSRFIHNKDASVVYPIGEAPVSEEIENPYHRKESLKLAIVGQLKKQKGQLDGVRAVKDLVKQGIDVELLLIGLTEEDAYLAKIEDYIKKYKLSSNIRLVGHVENPMSFMNYADIVITCATNESFGRVTVEAMSLGKPVIGANSAGTAEIIDSEDHGLLYKPGDHRSLSEKIKILATDSAKRGSIGKNAKKVYTKCYTKEVVYRPFVDYLNHSSIAKEALDLSPLADTISDFNSTVTLLNQSEDTVRVLRSNKALRFTQLIKKVLRRS